MADSRMFRNILVNALALRHHFPDNKKRDTKLEVDDHIVPCTGNNGNVGMLHHNNRSKAFPDNMNRLVQVFEHVGFISFYKLLY